MDILPDSIKKKLLITYFIGVVINFLILVFQSAGGHYDTVDLPKTWLWFLIYSLTIPVISVVKSNKNSNIKSKSYSRNYISISFGLLLVYFFLIFFVLLTHPFISQIYQISYAKVFLISNLWLAPSLLMVVFYLGNIKMVEEHYYHPTSHPKDRNLSEFESSKGEYNEYRGLKDKCSELIANNKDEEVLNILLKYYKKKDEDMHFELLHLKSRWNEIRRKHRMQLTPSEHDNVSSSRLKQSLIYYVGLLGDEGSISK